MTCWPTARFAPTLQEAVGRRAPHRGHDVDARTDDAGHVHAAHARGAFRVARRTIRSLALVFGREDSGLTREELVLCQHTAAIPTNDRFPTMNLAQSVVRLLLRAVVDRAGVAGSARASRRRRRSSASISARGSCCSRSAFCTRTIPTASTTTCAPSSPAPISTRARPRSCWGSSGRSSGRFAASTRRLPSRASDARNPLMISMNVSRSNGLRIELHTALGGILSTPRLPAAVKTTMCGRCVGITLADLLDELVAVQARHHQVEEDEVVTGVAAAASPARPRHPRPARRRTSSASAPPAGERGWPGRRR